MMIFVGLGVGLIAVAMAVYLLSESLRPPKTLLLGNGILARSLIREYESLSSPASFDILGHVCTGQCDCSLPSNFNLDASQSLRSIAKQLQVSTILIAVTKREAREYTQQILDCKLNGIKILDATMVSLHSEQTGHHFSYLDKIFHPFG